MGFLLLKYTNILSVVKDFDGVFWGYASNAEFTLLL